MATRGDPRHPSAGLTCTTSPAATVTAPALGPTTSSPPSASMPVRLAPSRTPPPGQRRPAPAGPDGRAQRRRTPPRSAAAPPPPSHPAYSRARPCSSRPSSSVRSDVDALERQRGGRRRPAAPRRSGDTLSPMPDAPPRGRPASRSARPGSRRPCGRRPARRWATSGRRRDAGSPQRRGDGVPRPAAAATATRRTAHVGAQQHREGQRGRGRRLPAPVQPAAARRSGARRPRRAPPAHRRRRARRRRRWWTPVASTTSTRNGGDSGRRRTLVDSSAASSRRAVGALPDDRSWALD